MTKFQDLRALEHKQDYLGLIQELKKLVKQDKRVFTDHYIKEWCGRRWRNLFITAAARDPQAVKVASKKLVGIKLRDTRPARQRIADRFMRLQDPTEWVRSCTTWALWKFPDHPAAQQALADYNAGKLPPRTE